MKAKNNVIEIKSICPATYSRGQRAVHDLAQIEAAIEELNGNIEDYGIGRKDKGQVYNNLGSDLMKWDCLTEYIISPIRYARVSLQRCIDELKVLSMSEEHN